jgi:hypothetical protein
MAEREIDPAATRRHRIVLWVFIILFALLLGVAVEAVVSFNQAVSIANHETNAYESLTNVRDEVTSALQRSNVSDLSDAFDSPDLKTARRETAAADAIAHNGNWTFLSHIPFTRSDVQALQALTGAASSLSHDVLDDYGDAVAPFVKLDESLSTGVADNLNDQSTLDSLRQQISTAEATSQKSLDKASAGLKSATKSLDSAPKANIGAIDAVLSQVRDLLDSATKKTTGINAKGLVDAALRSAVSKGRLTQDQAQSLGM